MTRKEIVAPLIHGHLPTERWIPSAPSPLNTSFLSILVPSMTTLIHSLHGPTNQCADLMTNWSTYSHWWTLNWLRSTSQNIWRKKPPQKKIFFFLNHWVGWGRIEELTLMLIASYLEDVELSRQSLLVTCSVWELGPHLGQLVLQLGTPPLCQTLLMQGLLFEILAKVNSHDQ